MLDEWNSWLFRSRFRRRILIKSWRVLLRVQRTTLANAVLVVRKQDRRVLAFASASGELRLPHKELDGWRSVTTQVEEWLVQLLQQISTPRLIAIEGTPRRRGVTFLYSADAEASICSHADGIWLDPDRRSPPSPWTIAGFRF